MSTLVFRLKEKKPPAAKRKEAPVGVSCCVKNEHTPFRKSLRRDHFPLSFAVLMEEMSITRMLVQAASSDLYSACVIYSVL